MLPNKQGSIQQRQETGEETALLSASRDEDESSHDLSDLDDQQHISAVVRRMKFQIWAGALSGLAIAIAIGAAFIAIVSLLSLLNAYHYLPY